MTRKLRNCITALLLTSAVCTVGSITAAALPFDAGQDKAAVAPVLALPVAGMDAAAKTVPPRKAGRAHRMRPSAGMPYFSFVPRG